MENVNYKFVGIDVGFYSGIIQTQLFQEAYW